MNLLYLNAYAVTRHLGGREEGGWYYDRGEPLASIPILAKRVPGHRACYNCSSAFSGFKNEKGEPYEICKDVPENFDNLETAEQDAILIRAQDVFHLEPNEPDIELLRNKLKEYFADQAYGRISSVLGGVEIQIQLEEQFAESWPKYKPRYE